MKKTWIGFAAGLILTTVFAIQGKAVPEIAKRYTAKDLKLDFRTDETAMFSQPAGICHDQNSIYVPDSEEHLVSIFSKSGSFRRSFGRKGQGPGEFDMPRGLDILGDRIYVADAINERIQILDKKGTWLGGFKVPFVPEQIRVFSGETIVVSHLPFGADSSEQMVHGYSKEGKLLWENVNCFFSGDMTYDSFRNLLVLIKGVRDDLFVIHKYNERTILRFARDGKSMPGIQVSAGYAFKKITLPVKGRNKDLQGFCWDATQGPDGPALLAAEYNAEKDLGPGRQIFLFDHSGTIRGIIDLPTQVIRIDMDGGRIYAFDQERILRIFSWQPE